MIKYRSNSRILQPSSIILRKPCFRPCIDHSIKHLGILHFLYPTYRRQYLRYLLINQNLFLMTAPINDDILRIALVYLVILVEGICEHLLEVCGDVAFL